MRRILFAALIVSATVTDAMATTDKVGRPYGCPQHNWCACWQAYRKGIDVKIAKLKGLWKASNWIAYGVKVPACAPGTIAVLPHHIGEVQACTPKGVLLLSGNHGGRVGVGVYAYNRITGYVQ